MLSGFAQQALYDKGLHRSVPVAAIGHIDRELCAVGGDANIALDQEDFASRAIEQENFDAAMKRKHQRRLGAIDEASGGQLRGPRLEKRRQRVAQSWPDRE